MRNEPKSNRLFLATILTYLVVMLLLYGLPALGISVELPLVLALISGELTLLIPAVIYLILCRINLRGLSERWRLPVAAVPLLILMAYCILPLVTLINLISMMLAGENAAAPMLGTLQQLPMWVSLLCISVLPGVTEEFIFRGILYSEYRKRRTWAAILVSALLFGLMHMNLNQFCYAFVMGVLFSLVYEATGSLLAPMLMHMVYNGNSVIMTYLSSDVAGQGNAEQATDMLMQMLGSDGLRYQLMMMVIMMVIAALVGLAAAGGLYVAVVKLCRRERQVLLLFQRNSIEKRLALECVEDVEATGNEEMTETTDEIVTERRNGKSRKIWGPCLWSGVLLAAVVIIGDVLMLKLA